MLKDKVLWIFLCWESSEMQEYREYQEYSYYLISFVQKIRW